MMQNNLRLQLLTVPDEKLLAGEIEMVVKAA